MYEGKRCRNCDTLLLGPFCHQCGQEHFDEVISTNAYVRDVAQRVYRFDGRFLDTIRRCLTWPGAVATDYLEGRRSKVVDPLQYFAACVFVQYVLAWAARKLTTLSGQESLAELARTLQRLHRRAIPVHLLVRHALAPHVSARQAQAVGDLRLRDLRFSDRGPAVGSAAVHRPGVAAWRSAPRAASCCGRSSRWSWSISSSPCTHSGGFRCG